jgi:uncharacterized protein YbjT (DUF2867 family)/ketosteroid isomerase-like protein
MRFVKLLTSLAVAAGFVCSAQFAFASQESDAIAAVQRFATAMQGADAAEFDDLFSRGKDVTAIENGVVISDRARIVGTLSKEAGERSGLRFELVDPRATRSGNAVWVVFGYHVSMGAGEKKVDLTGAGTAVMRREAGRYRIAHLHMGHKPAARKAAAAVQRGGVVLVVGATGRSGPALLAALKSEGYTQIRALVRDAEKAKATLGSDIEVVQGDVRDMASLANAMSGVRYIVSALGSNTFNDPTNSPELVDYEGVRNLAQAARAANVERFVQVSSLGVTRAKEHPLNRFGRVMEWKAKGEDALRVSGVPYTLVRAGGLQDTAGGESSIVALQGDNLITGQIPRADVAMVCVKALADPAASGKTLEVVSGGKGGKPDWASFFSGLRSDAKAEPSR